MNTTIITIVTTITVLTNTAIGAITHREPVLPATPQTMAVEEVTPFTEEDVALMIYRIGLALSHV